MSSPAKLVKPSAVHLALRILCGKCSQPLTLPVSKLTAVSVLCSRCGAGITLPTIEEALGDVMPRYPVPCPSCHARLQIDATALSRKRKCPECRTPLTLGFQRESLEPEKPESPGFDFGPVTRDSAGGSPPRETSGRDPEPDQFRRPNETQTDEPSPSRPAGMPEPVVYHGGGGIRAAALVLPRLNLPPRITGRTVWIVMQYVIPITLLAVAAEIEDLFPAVLALAFLPRFGLARQLTNAVLSLLVHTFSCPHCHEEYEARGRWSCGCGYNDHREQHILQFRCPLCGAECGHTNCQRCTSTIILR